MYATYACVPAAVTLTRPSPLSVIFAAARHVAPESIERFTRTGPDTILYKFTIDDPTTFTRPWSGEVPFLRMNELIYEYACHEGNYALSNVLSGARNEEKRTGKQQ